MPQATAALSAAGSGSKTGLIVALVAVVAALGVGGYFGYRLLFPEAGDGATTSPQAPAATPSPPTDAAKESTIASPAQPAATDSMQAAPAAPPADESKSATRAPPTDATRTTGAAAGKSPAAAPKADSTKATAPLAAPPPEAVPRVAAPAPPRTTLPVAGAQSDRWQQMAEAMAQCHREDFFSRVGCEQRVGRRFCEGYWGTVPQCPSGVPRDRGQ